MLKKNNLFHSSGSQVLCASHRFGVGSPFCWCTEALNAVLFLLPPCWVNSLMLRRFGDRMTFRKTLQLLHRGFSFNSDTTSLPTKLIGPIWYLQSPDLIMHKSWDATWWKRWKFWVIADNAGKHFMGLIGSIKIIINIGFNCMANCWTTRLKKKYKKKLADLFVLP